MVTFNTIVITITHSRMTAVLITSIICCMFYCIPSPERHLDNLLCRLSIPEYSSIA